MTQGMRAGVRGNERGSAVTHQDDEPQIRKVTITMPEAMHSMLRRQARRRGITVTELMRRAVALYQVLFEDPENEVLIKKGDQITRVIPA